ncbi:hypothetical protein JCM6882_005836 [Rhodosporidiobolus microsporus]
MASFFHQPRYTASWVNQRIYPRGEPSFDSPSTATSPSSPSRGVPSESRTLPDGRTLRFVDSPTPAPAPTTHVAPPPIYYPGQARRPSQIADLPAGHAPSTNTASTLHAKVAWAYHPLVTRGKRPWVRWLRARELWRSLKGEKELLWDGWPREFGGRELPPGMQDDEGDAAAGGDEEEAVGQRPRSASRSRSRSFSLSLSRRTTNGADSGVGLTPRPTMSLEVQHPLYPLYRTRIAELSEVIGEQLAITRAWLAFLEIGNVCWVVALIVALAEGGGKQTGFLKGVEIALVLVILLNGTGVNAVRMRRYALSRQLRQKQRDWSPLPTTLSTTNAQLMRNYLDGDVRDHNGAGDVASAMPKDRASLRWRLRETEGTHWLSFRPQIHVELVTPASATNPLAYLPVVDLSSGDGAGAGLGGGDGEAPPPGLEAVDIYPPTHGERAGEGERRSSERRRGETPTGAPPGYDEAMR